MCRIAGMARLRPLDADQVLQVQAMCTLQAHGGPDDEGLYADAQYPVVLGHRRLSLIDLSAGGHQPMTFADGNLVITYNGELYNYPALKEELKALGYCFRSQSDTEVILAAYAAWGTQAFKRFAGMFAFALFNRQRQEIYLVRDQTGIKPLYYHHSKEGLTFASEVRAFAALDRPLPAHPHWPVYFLAYGHLPEPVTTLQGVKPLPKGSYLRYEVATQACDVQTYGWLSYMEKEGDKVAVLSSVRQCLRTAVERHLLSDAPIGAFLSGGIDSSLMALLAGEAVEEKLTTLSIYFDEAAYSEKEYQELVASRLHGQHQAFCLTADQFTQSFPRILTDMDLPSNDGINTWFISQYAKEAGLKAVLSGLGGDELFGGYPSFERLRTAHHLQKLPRATLRAGRYGYSKKIKRLAYLSLPGIRGKYLFLRGQFVPTEIARLLGMAEEQVWKLLEEQPVLHNIQHLTHTNQASWMEMNLYMQNQLLRDSDVMSMAHGVEIRVPMLDLDFVRYVLRVQSNLKYEGGGKRLLVEAFSDLLPPAVYNRTKMGFSFPFQQWLAQNGLVKDMLLQAPPALRNTYSEFLKGRRHWSQVLSLALIQHHGITTPAAVSYA